MAIDFTKAACITHTNESIFGICDITSTEPNNKNPAYLDFADSDDWIGWVDNPDQKEVEFTAIDGCIEVTREDGSEETRCDCMLTYEDTIKFIELKDCDGGRWLGKASNQLRKTIEIYEDELGLDRFPKRYAYIINRQRPNFKSGFASKAQEFDDELGFILRVGQFIKID